MEKKIVVPHGLMEITKGYGLGEDTRAKFLTKILLWLSENPIAPSHLDEYKLHSLWNSQSKDLISKTPIADQIRFSVIEWQRHMFRAPEAIQCCERDTDGDGNCPIHSAPGVFRNPVNTKQEIPKKVYDTLYARGTFDSIGLTCVSVEDAVKALREAFRAGQESKESKIHS